MKIKHAESGSSTCICARVFTNKYMCCFPWPLPEATFRLYFSQDGLVVVAACCWAFKLQVQMFAWSAPVLVFTWNFHPQCPSAFPCWWKSDRGVPYCNSELIAQSTLPLLLCIQAYRVAASSRKIFIAFLLLSLTVITLELQWREQNHIHAVTFNCLLILCTLKAVVLIELEKVMGTTDGDGGR